MPNLTAVVVSDLHATSSEPGDSAGSWLTTHTPRTSREHPLVGLKSYLLENVPSLDLLLVAGDICDKADGVALAHAWADLVDIADSVGAKLIATAGNHDLDSRHKTGDMDPRGALYDLNPPFPALDDQLRDQFWARNYAIVEGPSSADPATRDWRVVTLNSAAFHGHSGDDGPELDHGRVSPRTARRLRDELSSKISADVNVMLVHHHLQQLPYVDQKEKSMIRDVELLNQILEEYSPWIVIHGHKHRSRIMFAPGEGYSATIFSAGSMCAFPYAQSAGAGVTNQAYIIKFADRETLDKYDFGVAGTFTSLQWIPDSGWRQATGTNDFSLPGLGGFGWRANPASLARKIAKKMEELDCTQLSASDLAEIEPRLKYLSPVGLTALAEELRRGAKEIKLKRDEYGDIIDVTYIISPDLQGAESNG